MRAELQSQTEVPRPKIQAPEKHQTPGFKHRGHAHVEGIGRDELLGEESRVRVGSDAEGVTTHVLDATRDLRQLSGTDIAPRDEGRWLIAASKVAEATLQSALSIMESGLIAMVVLTVLALTS